MLLRPTRLIALLVTIAALAIASLACGSEAPSRLPQTTEPKPATPSPTVSGEEIDSDGDGFDDAVEAHVGTDPLDACPDDLTDDAWPPDIVIDTVVDIFDAITFLAAFPSAEGGPNYSQRLDFSPDWGVIDIFDAITFLNHFPSTCTP